MTTLDQIKALIGDHTGKPAAEIGGDAPFASIYVGDFDSLDRLELAVKVSEHFHIDVPDDVVNDEAIGTPRALAEWVDEQNADLLTELPTEQESEGPITRDELLRRGVADDGESDQMVLGIVAKLGWPTASEPLGRTPTHALVPLDQVAAQTEEEPAVTHSGIPGVTWRKKPVEIEAVQFREIEVVDGTPRPVFNHPDLPQWLLDAFALPDGDAGAAWAERTGLNSDLWQLRIGTLEGHLWQLRIGTLEGHHTATPNDWIIRGVSGELYPCKPDIFAATYDPVEDAGEAHEPL